MSKRVSVMPAVVAIAVVLATTMAADVASGNDPLGPDAAAVVSGNNQFAFDLYTTLAGQKDGNLFFSPYSVSTALAMTYAGARGNTATEMADVLHFSLPQSDLHPAFAEVIGDLNASYRQGYQLDTANRLWGQQGYGFLPGFLDVTRDCYGAELAQVDFIGETELARQTINQWVQDQTQQKIQNLIPQGVLDSLTRLVLTNAVYFKSDWKYKFDPNRTHEASFWTTPDESITVPMMEQAIELKYADLPTSKVLEMPYTNEELSMLIFLPNEPDGLADLESWLTEETFSQSIDQMASDELFLAMPKFGMTQDFELSSVLASMGMPEAFNCGAADFSGMDGTRSLFISSVVHKGYVNLDEEGTEAAAATEIETSVGIHPVFIANHPFLFFIRDNRTQSVLFMGRVADLSAGAEGLVPEPAGCALLALGGVAILRRRK